MVTISVALATYNGERYLPEQLESLLAQSAPPDEVVVSDDASTDDTNRLVEDFCERAPFPVSHIVNERRIGFAENFLQAANRCRGDWVLFCDQDDVWLPDKIEVVKHFVCSTDRPCLIAHAALVADEELRPLPGKRIGAGGRSWRRREGGLWDVPPGFCQAVNRRLLSFDQRSRPVGPVDRNSRMAHDRWTYFVANALGTVRRIERPLAVYRRHPRTVTTYGREERRKPGKSGSVARYRFTRDYGWVCREYADYWADQSKRLGPDYAKKCERAASLYARAADFYHSRSEIHRPGNAPRDRIRALAALWRRSDPAVRAATAYSWKQRVLDAAAAFSFGPVHGSSDRNIE